MAQWQPGQSGNPGGRPKDDPKTKAIKAAAQEHSDAALAVLVAGLADDDARIRMKAAEAILDRGHGKPAQTLDATISGNLTDAILGLRTRPDPGANT